MTAVDPFSLEGRVVVVTGSSRGIGLAAARMLARRGARVVVSSRKADMCEAAGATLREEGLQAIAIPAHVGRTEDRERLVEETVRQLGRLDIMIVNAAVNPVFEAVSRLDEATWHKVIETNLTGAWHLARLSLPLIAEAGGGAMVFVTSVNARFGVARSGAYGISKAAVEQLVRQLAVEWGERDVRVNAVAPGTTRTDMVRALAADPAYLSSVVRRTPLRRLGEPEDVAAAVTFLASPAARHITGQVVTVDGGETIMRGVI